jgi:hypothetical protein
LFFVFVSNACSSAWHWPKTLRALLSSERPSNVRGGELAALEWDSAHLAREQAVKATTEWHNDAGLHLTLSGGYLGGCGIAAMSLSSLPPGFADGEPPTNGQGVRALRGREEIAQLTARLRIQHKEYESASQSWSPEAEAKKRELRKARADTLIEIGAVLVSLGEVERLQDIERLPFEQKLARLQAFLENAQGGSAAPSQERNTPLDAPDVAVDDIDAGWDDEETELEPEWRGPTPEQREVRAARAAARREKIRAKATEKAERRKTRAAVAKSKQKQKSRRLRNEPEPRRPSQSQAGEPVANPSPREEETPRVPSRRNGRRGLAFLVAIVLVAGGVALFLWRC